jgi:hypothetical protein
MACFAHALTSWTIFLYNSRLFRIRPPEKEQGEPALRLDAPSPSRKQYRAKHFYWIDHEDVFRKSP